MLIIKRTETRFCSLCTRAPGKNTIVAEIFDDNNLPSTTHALNIFLCGKHIKYLGEALVKFSEKEKRIKK